MCVSGCVGEACCVGGCGGGGGGGVGGEVGSAPTVWGQARGLVLGVDFVAYYHPWRACVEHSAAQCASPYISTIEGRM